MDKKNLKGLKDATVNLQNSVAAASAAASSKLTKKEGTAYSGWF